MAILDEMSMCVCIRHRTHPHPHTCVCIYLLTYYLSIKSIIGLKLLFLSGVENRTQLSSFPHGVRPSLAPSLPDPEVMHAPPALQTAIWRGQGRPVVCGAAPSQEACTSLSATDGPTGPARAQGTMHATYTH